MSRREFLLLYSIAKGARVDDNVTHLRFDNDSVHCFGVVLVINTTLDDALVYVSN